MVLYRIVDANDVEVFRNSDGVRVIPDLENINQLTEGMNSLTENWNNKVCPPPYRVQAMMETLEWKDVYPRMDEDQKEQDNTIDVETAKLGLATTEELFRELIARFTINIYGEVGAMTTVQNAIALAEMLGSLGPIDKEYRPVDND